jgi:pimeloyl-ACP methyl ester carboxylesterase
VALVGFSMGTGEVTRYIGKYGTDRVRKAVLIGTLGPYLVKASDNAEGVDPSVFEGIKSAIRADRPAFILDFLKNFYNYDADRILPPDATSRRQAKMIKHVKFAEIAGGPHGLCWTHADRVNAELVPFVE